MRALLLLLCLLIAFVHGQDNNTVDSDVVTNTSIPTKSAPYQQHHVAVIGSITGVFGAIIHTLIFLFVMHKSENDTFRLYALGMWGLGLLGFILFETEFFVNMWNTYVHRVFWDRETFIVKNTTVSYYTCANVQCNHGCTNLPNSDSCSFMQTILRPGPCNNGYKCCSTITLSYPCGSYKNPSTCYYTVCDRSVQSLRCDVIVGLCANVQSQVYYQERNVQYNTVYNQRCGLNDTTCVSNLLQKYVPGYTFRASINPESPDKLVENISYRDNELAGMIFGVIFLCIAYLFLVLQFCIWVWENRESWEWPSLCHWPDCQLSFPDCRCWKLWQQHQETAPIAVNNDISAVQEWVTPTDQPPAYSLTSPLPSAPLSYMFNKQPAASYC
jgi:hypothetical protein